MLMFRFWSSDSRGCDKTLQVDRPLLDLAKPLHTVISSSDIPLAASPRPPKRRRQSNVAIASQPAAVSSAPTASDAPARIKTRDDVDGDHDKDDARPHKRLALSSGNEGDKPSAVSTQPDMDRIREVVENELGLEILLKHDELRLINQELAKCQIALEQLRRCHLIPYPTNVPTPEQMLHVVNGTGPALKHAVGDKVPEWAPPFGVTDGPYARHYAKWLIPDPKFDGAQYEPPARSETARLRTSFDGRPVRNGAAEPGHTQATGRGRPARGTAGQKLHSLTGGNSQPKGHGGPCIAKRTDGQTVKLVCTDCHREDFFSTQGFINHCRIAHKRDYKSHEEAANHCGHPITGLENIRSNSNNSNSNNHGRSNSNSHSKPVEQRPVVQSPPASGLAHPLAREKGFSESESHGLTVVRRIEELWSLYLSGQHPMAPTTLEDGKAAAKGVSKALPTIKAPKNFKPSTVSPSLSQHLQAIGFDGNLDELVNDAKTRVDLDGEASSDEDMEDSDAAVTPIANEIDGQATAFAPRMRVPASSTMSATVAKSRPQSSKGPSPIAYAAPVPTPLPRVIPNSEPVSMDDDMLDADLSPNTAVSNNAPSLVSDDGEYDDSADSESDSGSEVDDSLDAQSISDVDEIDIDDHAGSRHRGSAGAGAGTTVRLRKDDSKHVTFVSPVKNSGKQGRPRKFAPGTEL